MLGRRVSEHNQNQTIIYFYDDGSYEKKGSVKFRKKLIYNN